MIETSYVPIVVDVQEDLDKVRGIIDDKGIKYA